MGIKLTGFYWSGRRDLNPRPSAWEADTLPLSYARINNLRRIITWSVINRHKFIIKVAKKYKKRENYHCGSKPSITRICEVFTGLLLNPIFQ